MVDLETIKGVWALISAPILALLGYLGWNVKRAHARIDVMITEQQVRAIIDDKLAGLHAQHRAFEHRLQGIDNKLDMLIRLHISKSDK